VADDAAAAAEELLGDLGLGAPGAQAVVKAVARRSTLADVPGLLAETSTLSTELFGRPEAAEGMAAFSERRAPAWVPA
jgi:enoyl-CoA hydratase/carnithine racemase